MDLFIPRNFAENEGTASLEALQDSEKIKVPSVQLDTIIDEPIKLLKLDIEGHEHSALLGSRKLLSQKEVKFIIFEDFTGKGSDTIKLLESHGYKVSRIQKNLFGPKLIPYKNDTNIPSWEPINYLGYIDESLTEVLFSSLGWSLFHAI